MRDFFLKLDTKLLGQCGVLVLLLLVVSGVGLQYVYAEGPPGVSIHFFDVGQGDSIFLTSSSGRRVLIDTGPDEHLLRKELESVLPPLDKRIDILFITHSDHDHRGGAEMLLRDFEIGQVVLNQEKEVTEGVQGILRTAEMLHIPVAFASPDQDLKVDSSLFLDILTPLPGFTKEEHSPNDNSIVFMLIMPKDRILFTGDAEKDAEMALVHSGRPLNASWLKGGHHGSKTSTSEVFLNAVSPKHVIFQNSIDNTYGHPAPEVVARLEDRLITVYNTSIHGRIHLRCPIDQECFLKTIQRDNSE